MFLGIIQARLDSRRFPRKVLADLCGKPLLWHVVEQTRKIKSLSGFVVATPDEEILRACPDMGVMGIRCTTRRDDVLGRFCEVLRIIPSEYVVRICADSPLLDPMAADELCAAATETNADYVGYAIDGSPAVLKPTGYFCEVAKAAALRIADTMLVATAPEREHVTQRLYAQPGFRCHWLDVPEWWKQEADQYLAVDTPADLEMIRKMMEVMA